MLLLRWKETMLHLRDFYVWLLNLVWWQQQWLGNDLGIERMDDQPKTSTVPERLQHLGKSERKNVLTNIAAKVVN